MPKSTLGRCTEITLKGIHNDKLLETRDPLIIYGELTLDQVREAVDEWLKTATLETTAECRLPGAMAGMENTLQQTCTYHDGVWYVFVKHRDIVMPLYLPLAATIRLLTKPPRPHAETP